MELVVLVSAALLLAAAVVLVGRSRLGDTQSLSLLQQQMNALTQQVDARLSQMSDQILNTNKAIGERLDNAAAVVGNVQRGLGELTESSKRILEVGKDISGLNEILRSPKLRGGVGELLLGDLLAQILPCDHYSLQHQLKNGERVDAVVKLANGLVPVDAKFPLDNFRRIMACATDEERKPFQRRFAADVKKHIDDIVGKYICPDEGTFDFALMYIPAENVYYEVIIKDEMDTEGKGLLSYALSQHVVPVSPNSLYAYLATIVLGLRGLKIEENVKDVLANIGRLKQDFARFQDDFETLGKHINAASHKYEDADKKLTRFGDRLQAVEAAEAPEGSREGAKLIT
ncbi:MAG: DNA recombination protein RmuC [Chloroflexi bacterium]|nr:DNA recombination protein RmuC [Chloroflexota bacterium]